MGGISRLDVALRDPVVGSRSGAQVYWFHHIVVASECILYNRVARVSSNP